MKPIDSFFVALQFLTRFPVRLRNSPEERTIGYSLPFYPLVGLILGATLAGVCWLLRDSADLLRASLMLAAWVILTGALHLDGLADSADAWIGGLGDRERTLAIMKDPYCGPAGVATLVVVLLIKFSALHSLRPDRWITLMFIPAVARAAIPLLFLTTPYVRAAGLGTALAGNLPRLACLGAIVFTSIVVVAVAQMNGWWLLVAMGTVWLVTRYMMVKRIGGSTGDTAGALIELSETAMLVTAAAAS